MTECALNKKQNADGSCLSNHHIQILTDFSTNIKDIISRCNDDECIIDNTNAPIDIKSSIKREALKVSVGKINDNYWLNNTEIDNVMSQFRLNYKGFGHGFIHMCDLETFEPSNLKAFDYPVYPVKELDFAGEFRHSLTKLKKINKPDSTFVSKISTYNNAPLTSYGIICNTDSSKGRGQHWFCIFISTDQLDPDDTSKPWIRIELFNSAGGGCSDKNFNIYWNNQAMEISKATGLKCTFDEITSIQHQSDDTGNCGSYSLFYIYSRLNHCLPSEFDDPKNPITDYAMLKFRSVCFRVDSTENSFQL